MTLWIVALLIAFFAWYVIKGRSWLKDKPSMAWLYKSRAGEWIERTFFKKSESILWGRFLQALGYGLSAIASLGGIDLTPLAAALPENMSWVVFALPLAIALAGHIQVQLRLDTTRPIELVNLPENVPADVQASMTAAELRKDQAVAVVQEAKAAGAV